MGLLLFILSNILAIVLLPAGVVYGIVTAFWKHRFKTGVKGADRKFLTLATAIDKYGNVACAELLNATLIKKESPYRFGKIEQTISAVIGLNLLNNSLTRAGHVLDDMLDFFDEGHSIRAAQSVTTKSNNQTKQPLT
jgi:hypothetical protein